MITNTTDASCSGSNIFSEESRKHMQYFVVTFKKASKNTIIKHFTFNHSQSCLMYQKQVQFAFHAP